MSNPYSINKDENKFLAYASGYEANGTLDDCPFSEDNEPEFFKIWSQGYRANKGRTQKAPNLNAVASNGVTPISASKPSPSPPGLDLTAVPSDQLFQEVSRRLAEGHAILDRVKKLLG